MSTWSTWPPTTRVATFQLKHALRCGWRTSARFSASFKSRAKLGEARAPTWNATVPATLCLWERLAFGFPVPVAWMGGILLLEYEFVQSSNLAGHSTFFYIYCTKCLYIVLYILVSNIYATMSQQPKYLVNTNLVLCLYVSPSSSVEATSLPSVQSL